jgi:hypothetical protein
MASGWIIFAQRPKGPRLHFDGRKFTNAVKPKYYGAQSRAVARARELVRNFRILRERHYKVWVDSVATQLTRQNPEPRGLDEAARKLEEFSGHPADKVVKARISDQRQGLVIGNLRAVEYDARRDGVDGDRLLRYIHKFKRTSRPLLAVTKDGTQLHIVGGRYEFTEAGIEDR